jgi:hypothetical protein
VPRVSVGAVRYRPSGEERVFADESGRVWSAAFTREAIVFTCVSDGRQSGRAIAVTEDDLHDDLGDDTLRRWLSSAPHIGRLT